ncbi:MAG: hypothetical protein JST00_02740 [Deltaproteobacteria bacterium]|nr:hypothetical protein [Deltaproteobacteria bacterium]
MTVPSPATRGEPFTTTDGWVVRMEKVALSVLVSSAPASSRAEGRGYGSAGWLFDAATPVALYAPEIAVGSVRIGLALRGNYVFVGRQTQSDRRRIVGVSPEDVDRSNEAPEQGFDDPYVGAGGQSSFGEGPSILLRLRAERGGKVVTMDLRLAVSSFVDAARSGAIVDVIEDDIVTRPAEIRIEELLRDGNGRIAFSELAAADKDGDGRVTMPELRATTTTCKCPITAPAHNDVPFAKPDLVDLLELNAAKTLVPR